MKIAIWGMGSLGTRLAQLLQGAGYDVLVCAREPIPESEHTFAAGAAQADLLVLAIPYGAIADLLKPLAAQLAGKTIIDCSNPLHADWSAMLLGQENSAGEEVARLVPDAYVVKAFNTIFADVMPAERHDRDGQLISAFVAGDDVDSKNVVITLARALGFAPVDVGPLRIARYLEAMAHLNIQIAVAQGGGTNAAFIYHQKPA